MGVGCKRQELRSEGRELLFRDDYRDCNGRGSDEHACEATPDAVDKQRHANPASKTHDARNEEVGLASISANGKRVRDAVSTHT